MDDTNEWHVVQRKKKDTKSSTSVVPKHYVHPHVSTTNITNTANTANTTNPQKVQNTFPNKFMQKNKFKDNNEITKNKHHIENNLLRHKNDTEEKHNIRDIPKDDNENTEIVDTCILENNTHNDVPYQMIGNGVNIQLTSEYVLWVHSTQNNDWSLAGYTKLCTIHNVSEFWRLFNNLHKLNFKNNNFFLMKHTINPIWEDESNRYGGICSLRVEMDHALKVYELLCIFLMCEKLVSDIADINGISITPKNNWAILKIWNKDKNNKIDKLLHKSILDKYKNVSIQYKQNQPEY